MTGRLIKPSCIAVGLACFGLPVLGLAQSLPDAGRLLQEQKVPPALPREAPVLKFEQALPAPLAPGGATVPLKSAVFTGNTVFDSATLLTVLADAFGKPYDLAGLRGLADTISAHYREAGYPFARAYLPPQSMAEGELRIAVVEGRYGAIRAISNDEALRNSSEAMLAQLKMGDVIESELLERITLTLDDQPGIKVSPIIRPGQELGTGDLDVRVERTPGFSGDVGFDNHGNRFTGEHRVRANLQWDSPFSFGDQVTVRSLYSEEAMWLGSLSYNLPLGTSGLRGNVGYTHTYYELAKDFSGKGEGTARVTSLGVMYPIIRSQKANLNLGVTFQHKQLDDTKVAASEDKSSASLPLALSFDHRDGLWGGGITYGSFVYTVGKLKLDSTAQNTDIDSGQNTRGSFDRWNLDIARVQTTPVTNLVLFGRVSAQWAGHNLDSSEGFSLGGVNGVRAYPTGEGNGDEGWLVQLEARYTMGAFSPFVFHDRGRVTLNANNGSLTTPVNPNHRSIGGEGVGLRYTQGAWNLDANLSWRLHGGKPQSDGAERNPRFWLTAGYRF